MAKPGSICPTPGCPQPMPCLEHERPAWTKRTRPVRSRTSTAAWSRRRNAVLRRDRHTCQTCGAIGNQVDHVTPVSEDGTDELTNLATICDPCHKAKTEGEKQAGLARWRAAGCPPR